MTNKPLCCMIKNATMEQIESTKRLLRDNPEYLIHDENVLFYYPSDEVAEGMPTEFGGI